jgi:ribose transport system substrate-binding protein
MLCETRGLLDGEMPMPRSTREPYVVRSVVHAAQVMRAFQSPGETLRLRDVVERTGLGKGLCFRLLHTLHHVGVMQKVDATSYRLTSEMGPRRRYRIGYAGQGQDTSFPREVVAGLRRAADREGIELIVVDNRYQPKVALRNAEHLVREQVDLVIEFQTDEAVAPAIAARYMEAQIPLIAIDVPHPGATYFGANNYQAGLLAGRHLGQWAKTRWQGRVDEVMLLELGRAGSLVHGRMSGVLAGLRETLHEAQDPRPVVSIDCDGQFKTALEKVRKHVRESRASHVLVGAANDPSALGAARAFQEAGRAGTCAIVGHNAEPDARAELREPRTPFVASVAFFPEKYGDGLMKLAGDILGHRPTPPAVFIHHQLVTTATVDHLYPNDALLGAARAGIA